jgi:hypothetical protein
MWKWREDASFLDNKGMLSKMAHDESSCQITLASEKDTTYLRVPEVSTKIVAQLSEL